MKTYKKTKNISKPSIASKLLQLVSGLWVKYIKTPINNLWWRTIEKPYLDYKREKAKKAEIYNIKTQFSKNFANHDLVRDLMYNKPYQQTDTSKLNDDLINNRKKMSSVKSGKIPFLFEPDIIDIHNDNLNINAPSLENLIKIDDENAKESLRKQIIKRKTTTSILNNNVTDKDKIFTSVSEDEKSEDVSLQTIRAIDGERANRDFKHFIDTLNNIKK